jgi:PAS domain S-box-containing protein
MMYHPSAHGFDEHERAIAVSIARQVGFSIERARAEQARQAAEAELRESEARFRVMSESAPVMVWMSDARGACLHLNRMQREFWQVTEDQLPNFDWLATAHPDDAPVLAEQVQAAVAARRPLSVKARFRNAGGDFKILQTSAQPRFSAAGAFQGMIGVNIDVTERDLAEQALRESEERFRLAVEAAPSGMVMTDAEGRIMMLNARAERLLGYGRDELEGQPIETIIPDRFTELLHKFRSARQQLVARQEPAGLVEAAIRCRDEAELPVEIGISPILGRDGPMSIAAVIDISARKRADAQRDLLLAELNHRVKNTLAVVQAIANQTFRVVGAEEARAAFQGRLAALGAAHTLLTHGNWENAPLQRLAADALRSGGVDEARATLSGPPVLLSPRQALSFSLALHELATNATKYGALSNDLGRLSVVWDTNECPRPMLRLLWREEGGPRVVEPLDRGFGSFLIERALAQELQGQVFTKFAPTGLECTIEAPLS